MRFTNVLACASAFQAFGSLAMPTPEIASLETRADGPGHPYVCDAKYHTVSTKKALLADGATLHDIATTMLET